MKINIFFILLFFTLIKESYSQRDTPMKSYMESKIIIGGMDGLGNLYGLGIGYGQNIGKNFYLKPNLLVFTGGQKDPNIQSAKAKRVDSGHEKTAQLFGLGVSLHKALNVDDKASLSLGLGVKYFKIYSTNYTQELVVVNNEQNRYLIPIFSSYSAIGPEVELQYKQQITERFGLFGLMSFTSAAYVVNLGLGMDIKF